jgi:hypothetical protein
VTGQSGAGAPRPGLGRRPRTSDYDHDDHKESASDNDDDDLAGPVDRDGDREAIDSPRYFDSDEASVGVSARSAGLHDRRAIARLVRGYFAAARAGNGAAACRLIRRDVAASLPHAVPPYARGRTCPPIMARLFAVNRVQLVAEAARLVHVHAYVKGDEGWALVTFRGLATRGFPVAHETRIWKLGTVFDQELP